MKMIMLKLRTQVMELGEPDEDGRRKPIAVEGQTEDIRKLMLLL